MSKRGTDRPPPAPYFDDPTAYPWDLDAVAYGKLKARASNRAPRVTPREDTGQGARHRKDLTREKVVRERMARVKIVLVPN